MSHPSGHCKVSPPVDSSVSSPPNATHIQTPTSSHHGAVALSPSLFCLSVWSTRAVGGCITQQPYSRTSSRARSNTSIEVPSSVAIIRKRRQSFFRAKKNSRSGRCRSVQTSVGPRCLGFGVLGFWSRTKKQKKEHQRCHHLQTATILFFSRQKGLQIRKVSFRSNFRGTPMFGFWGFGFFDADRTKKKQKKKKRTSFLS